MSYLDPYQQYMSGDHSMPQAPAGGGLIAALPAVGLGLQGVGLLSSLYGNYKQQKAQERQYRDQKAEYERQQALAAEDRKLKQMDDEMSREQNAGNYAGAQRDNRLARYQDYFKFRGI
jgi:hypothetical protein